MYSVQVLPLLQVQIIDVENQTYSDTDVIIVGTDGLWDVISNTKAVEIVRSSVSTSGTDNKDR